MNELGRFFSLIKKSVKLATDSDLNMNTGSDANDLKRYECVGQGRNKKEASQRG